MSTKPTKKTVWRSWQAILKQAGYPPLRLAFDSEWKAITGHSLGRAWGRASKKHLLVGVRYQGRTLEQVKETLWHEVGHILFPSKPHWWVECFGEIMAGHGNGDNRYSQRYAHSPADLPGRAKLLALCRKAAVRLQQRVDAEKGGAQDAPQTESTEANQKENSNG
jgi:hypothetical protein